ncbi:AI-2E family transporter [Methylogaea oryzae]|uniref:AI-2E family transporter n=1 Tax=Methylogaea oryzae TaxID=1295382 RepID=A0A8D4VMW2_9GAMM|nr:AI-2E family transporter [Methylogaea oryzae]BBL70506.1 AI-2E family transporter [Methylogaea oryzae]
MDKMLKPVFLGALLTGLLALAYLVLRNFVTPLAWAMILAYISWPLYARLTRLTGDKTVLSALLMVIALLAAIVVPSVWLTYLLRDEVVGVYHDFGELLRQKPVLPEAVGKLPGFGPEAQRLFEQLTDPETLRARVLPWLRGFSVGVLQLLGDVGYLAAVLLLTLFSVFFLYRDGRQITREVSRVLHLVMGERVDAYLATAGATVKAVVYGLVLTAIGQGAIAGLGYWFVGLKSPVLLTLVTMFFAMIPFGTPVVWIAASLWLLLQGRHLDGVELLVWGTAVVSWVDNVIRPLVISSNTSIPFLLVFFGVLGGLAAFGFIGLFVGPVILAVLLAVWREWLEQHGAEEFPQG